MSKKNILEAAAWAAAGNPETQVAMYIAELKARGVILSGKGGKKFAVQALRAAQVKAAKERQRLPEAPDGFRRARPTSAYFANYVG